MKPPRPLENIKVIFEGEVRDIKNNEDVLPSQPELTPVRQTERVCGGVEAYNE